MTDPFDNNQLGKTLFEIVKNLECRWGLTLVSFLPTGIEGKIRNNQIRVSNLCTGTGQSDTDLRVSRPIIAFYAFENCHCTHFTIARSDPKGPVTKRAIAKNDHALVELYQILNQLTMGIGPMIIELNRIRLSKDRLGIVLTGNCKDEKSIQYRHKLLKTLNELLPSGLDIHTRSWDRDPSQFGKLHCAIGYLKRPPPQGYNVFCRKVRQMEISPIQFTLKNIVVVHHRRRSLAFPQEGMVTFQLGRQPLTMSGNDFVHDLNLN